MALFEVGGENGGGGGFGALCGVEHVCALGVTLVVSVVSGLECSWDGSVDGGVTPDGGWRKRRWGRVRRFMWSSAVSRAGGGFGDFGRRWSEGGPRTAPVVMIGRTRVGLIGHVWGMVAISVKSETPAPYPPTYLVRALLPTFRGRALVAVICC